MSFVPYSQTPAYAEDIRRIKAQERLFLNSLEKSDWLYAGQHVTLYPLPTGDVIAEPTEAVITRVEPKFTGMATVRIGNGYTFHWPTSLISVNGDKPTLDTASENANATTSTMENGQ